MKGKGLLKNIKLDGPDTDPLKNAEIRGCSDSYAAKFFEKNIHAQKTDNNDEKPPNKRYKYTITGWLIFFRL